MRLQDVANVPMSCHITFNENQREYLSINTVFNFVCHLVFIWPLTTVKTAEPELIRRVQTAIHGLETTSNVHDGGQQY